MVARDSDRVQESGGARNGRVDDSSGPLVKGTSVEPESLSCEGRQASLAGSYPGVRVAGQAPVEDVPPRVGQRKGRGTIRGLGAARLSATRFVFGQGGFMPTIPVFNGTNRSI